MAPYLETETMTIKRINVALKKKDWSLLEEGIAKIKEKFQAGHGWQDAAGWQELLMLAGQENVPDVLMTQFSTVVGNILENCQTGGQTAFSFDYQEVSPAKTEETFTDHNVAGQNDNVLDANIAENYETSCENQEIPEPVTIFYNEQIDFSHISAIKKHRATLNNVIFDNNKYAPEPGWFEELSKLVNSLDKPNNELAGLLSVFSQYESSGTIITSSYDSSIVKDLIKSDMNFAIPEIKTVSNSEKCWNLYPLGGISCIYLCSNCGHKMLKTDSSSRTIVGSCTKCASPAYPDMADINGERPEVNPRIWYQSFGNLVKSKIWILINPPASGEQPMIRSLIEDAAEASSVRNINIITSRIDVINWWKNNLSNLTSAEINCYASIDAFLGYFSEAMASNNQVLQLA